MAKFQPKGLMWLDSSVPKPSPSPGPARPSPFSHILSLDPPSLPRLPFDIAHLTWLLCLASFGHGPTRLSHFTWVSTTESTFSSSSFSRSHRHLGISVPLLHLSRSIQVTSSTPSCRVPSDGFLVSSSLFPLACDLD